MQIRSLTGITWNHTSGYLPLVAAAQRFADRDPGEEIVWQTAGAGEVVHAYLRDGGDPRRVLDDMNCRYHQSRANERA
jgi:hypothetical protein